MRWTWWLLTIAVLALACGPATSPSQSGPDQASGHPRYGGTLSIRQHPDPFSFDITFSKTIPNDRAVATVYESLLGFKMGPDYEYAQWELRPELAERWEISPDARSFTFHLRKGVKFQD